MTHAEANHLLDLVRAGADIPESEILFALLATGDFVVSPIRVAEVAA